MASRITYRKLRDPGVLREAVQLQLDVWGMDPRDAMPWSQMILIERHGGVVLGAFERGRMVGFLYSFVGYERGETFLYSKMLGVRPTHRGRGIGRALKRRQRREALALGYRRIQWTFDPLERASALLNVGYLGVRARRYVPDFYGPGGIGKLHAGLDSDRLVAEWHIREPATARRQRRRAVPGPPPGAVRLVEAGSEGPERTGAPGRFPALVAVPGDIQGMKRTAPATAARWQRTLREVLTRALAAGGEVTDVARERSGSRETVYYVLTRRAGARVRARRGR